MKKFLSIVALSLLSAMVLSAQKIQGTITIQARENLLSKLPAEAAYFLPEFMDATVQSTDGQLSNGRINICLVDNSVRFIQPETGDTLLLSSPENIMRIIIGDTVMLQHDGDFIKAVAVYGKTFLGERRTLSLEDADIEAGYSSIPATSTAKRANVVSVDYDRMRNGENTVNYSLSIKYFIGDGISLYPARLSSFLKVFPEKKKDLRLYAKEHKTDFNDKSDLIDFFYHCTE